MVERRLNPAASFASFAWFVLAFNVLVIGWGAYVRASGSGAGCGAHWPLCNGEIVPHAPATHTLIELSHRVSAGLSMALVALLAGLSFRASSPGAPIRKAAAAAVFFSAMEAAIGAFLVLFEHVAHDASAKRALSGALHLVNSFVLLGAIALTVAMASGRWEFRPRRHALGLPLYGTALGFLLTGMTGAVAALGDTLFPTKSLAEGFAADLSPTAHLYLRLRMLHPFAAVAVALGALVVAGMARAVSKDAGAVRLSYGVTGLVVLQMMGGVLNLALRAPVAMQLVHLALGDATWIAFVLMAGRVLSEPHHVEERAGAEEGQPAIDEEGRPGHVAPGG